MKRFLIFLVITITVSATSYAAENSNPFNPQPIVPAIGQTFPQLLDDPLPQTFTENRSIFDTLEIVGRSTTFAVLRYPMVGTTTQGTSYREFIVKSGKNSFIGGRSFKAVFPQGGTNVLLVDKNGKILWEGDLSAPKTYQITPNVIDYQYTPPVSAGAGIGQSLAGSTSIAGNQISSPTQIQSIGAIR